MNLPQITLISGGSVTDIFLGIVNLVIQLAGVVALVYIIIGGYTYLTSGGAPDGAEKGKKTITYAAIGLLIVFASYAIIQYVQTQLNKF